MQPERHGYHIQPPWLAVVSEFGARFRRPREPRERSSSCSLGPMRPSAELCPRRAGRSLPRSLLFARQNACIGTVYWHPAAYSATEPLWVSANERAGLSRRKCVPVLPDGECRISLCIFCVVNMHARPLLWTSVLSVVGAIGGGRVDARGN